MKMRIRVNGEVCVTVRLRVLIGLRVRSWGGGAGPGEGQGRVSDAGQVVYVEIEGPGQSLDPWAWGLEPEGEAGKRWRPGLTLVCEGEPRDRV